MLEFRKCHTTSMKHYKYSNSINVIDIVHYLLVNRYKVNDYDDQFYLSNYESNAASPAHKELCLHLRDNDFRLTDINNSYHKVLKFLFCLLIVSNLRIFHSFRS